MSFVQMFEHFCYIEFMNNGSYINIYIFHFQKIDIKSSKNRDHFFFLFILFLYQYLVISTSSIVNELVRVKTQITCKVVLAVKIY